MASVPRRGPSYLKRIERRAESLSNDREYAAHLADVRRKWNRLWPHFAVKGKGIPPDDEMIYDDVPAPQTLIDALAIEAAAIWPPVRVDDLVGVVMAGGDEIQRGPTGAAQDWINLVHDVALTFWPESDFPHGLTWRAHPAVPFVALGLVYDPRMVSKLATWRHTLQPHRIPFDPQYPEDDPTMARAIAERRSLWEALRQARGEGHGLTAEEITRALHEALHDGIQAYRKAERDAGGAFSYFPIFPGLTAEDLREAEPAILQHSHHLSDGGDFTRQRIHAYRAEGLSHEVIAKLLGMPRSTVSGILDGK